ncbi:hypothetical protein MKK63_25755 [Methylobacterium sp. J-088]|uniref:hypothetical protein n=1 Tax=unclassified Methylobacterium TaxID=2615210 RepID=UPI001FBAF1D9|nr:MULTISPECIES: hypothetical protein [unclassified Methylobacterium]MCJ2066082.1 hypothetical protein [Methylobacterium sp. J-088]
MDGILQRAVDRTLHLNDALDDVITGTEAAVGFAAATPMISALNGDAHFEPDKTER